MSTARAARAGELKLGEWGDEDGRGPCRQIEAHTYLERERKIHTFVHIHTHPPTHPRTHIDSAGREGTSVVIYSEPEWFKLRRLEGDISVRGFFDY